MVKSLIKVNGTTAIASGTTSEVSFAGVCITLITIAFDQGCIGAIEKAFKSNIASVGGVALTIIFIQVSRFVSYNWLVVIILNALSCLYSLDSII